MSSPSSWDEAADRAQQQLYRAQDKYLAALKCTDETPRLELIYEAIYYTRGIAEPLASYIKYGLKRANRVITFHEWVSRRIPKWEAFKLFREAYYHDNKVVTFEGMRSTGPFDLHTGPNEAVTVWGSTGSNMIQVRKKPGELNYSQGPAQETYQLHGYTVEIPIPGFEKNMVEVPKDVVQAWDKWRQLIPALSNGWDPGYNLEQER